jgi:uncharacterized membrane-anchored protein
MWSMTPLEKCMQTLSAFVRLDDLEGLDLMEAAVADLLEAAGSAVGRMGITHSASDFAVRRGHIAEITCRGHEAWSVFRKQRLQCAAPDRRSVQN